MGEAAVVVVPRDEYDREETDFWRRSGDHDELTNERTGVHCEAFSLFWSVSSLRPACYMVSSGVPGKNARSERQDRASISSQSMGTFRCVSYISS